MLAILLLAAIVRFAYPQSSPQGLQVDEASNLWNAWCILHSGYDEHQVRFPIFYTQSFGDNRSALFLYFLIPFEAVLGPTVIAAHIAAGFYGICAVALIGYIGRRLGGPAVGLISALFLAVCPWHVQNTRWAHEATIAPLLVLIAIASLLWAEVPLADSTIKSKWNRAFLAGLLTGIACYGYAAIRLFLPAFLFITCVVNYRQWHDWLRQNSRSFIALVFGFAITFTPLLYKHLTDPRINLRGQSTWVWNPTDTFPQRLEKVLARYPGHFGIDFLFLHGSGDPSVSPPSGFGNLHWYLLPFLLIGLIAMIYRFRDSLSARVLMIGVLVYPVGDLLNYHNGINTLRSFPGLPMLILAAAVGADAAVRWLRSQGLRVLAPAIILFSCVFLFFNVLFYYRFFGSFNRDPIRWRVRNVDVLEACEWLEPRWQQVDAVFWSQTNRSFLYAPTLDYLRYDTADWFLGGVDRMSSAGTRYAYSDLVVRYGKMYFMFLPQQMLSALNQLKTSHTMHDVVFIVSPGELNLDQHFPITVTIRDPAGNVSLEIIELRF
ncbi:MAG TPA: hypothetical protein VGG19_18820 [Tepidisphaeraceae bacterium]|jgi:hypothetical protein